MNDTYSQHSINYIKLPHNIIYNIIIILLDIPPRVSGRPFYTVCVI